MKDQRKSCTSCGKRPLIKDEIGISKKMLGQDNPECFCIECLAGFLETTVEELHAKIEEFKEEGCTLFS